MLPGRCLRLGGHDRNLVEGYKDNDGTRAWMEALLGIVGAVAIDDGKRDKRQPATRYEDETKAMNENEQFRATCAPVQHAQEQQRVRVVHNNLSCNNEKYLIS